MSNPFLLGIAAAGIVCSSVATYYISLLRNSFVGLRRLERPWLVLECGVAFLVVAALTIPLLGISTTIDVIQIAAVVFAAFFILTAMAMMKRAWTIGEGD